MADNLIKKLENNPKFWELPYSDQIYLRSEAFDKTVVDNKAYKELPLEERIQIKEDYVFSMPQFESLGMGWQVKLIARRYKANDPDAIKLVNYSIGASNYLENFALGKLFKKAGIDPFKIAAEIGNLAYDVGRSLKNDFERVMLDKDRPLKIERTPKTSMNYLMGKEALKMKEYFRYLASDDKIKSTALQRSATIGSGAGLITDVALGTVAGSGYLKAAGLASPSAAFAKKMADVAAGTAKGRYSYNFLKYTLPTAQRSFVSAGISGVARETILDLSRAEANGTKYEFDMMRTLKQYSAYAAGDYAFGMAVNKVLPSLRMIGKIMFGKVNKSWDTFSPDVKNFIKKGKSTFSKANIDELIDDYVTGGTIPKALKDQLPKELRIKLDNARYLNEAGKVPMDKLQYDLKARTTITANRFNKMVEYADDGIYLHQDVKGELISVKYPSQHNVFKALSEDAMNTYKGINDDLEKALFREEHQWLMNYSELTSDISNAFKRISDDIIPNDLKIKASYLEKAGDRISPENRLYLSPTEAKSFKRQMKSYGYSPFYFKAENIDDIKLAVKNGKSYKITLGTGDSDSFVTLRNIAPLQEYNEALKYVDDIPGSLSKDDKISYVLMKHGYDGAIIDDKGTILVANARNTKILDSSIDPLTGLRKAEINTQTKRAGLNELTGQATAKRIIEKEVLGKSIAHNDQFLIKEISNLSGNMTENNVRNVTKLYLLRGNKQYPNINIRLTDNPAGFAFVRTSGDNLYIAVPRKIGTKGEFRNFLKTYTTQMNKIIDDGGDKIKITSANIEEFFSKKSNLYVPPGKSYKESYVWFKDLIENAEDGSIRDLGNGSFALKLPGEPERVFKSLDEMIDNFIVRNLNEDYVRYDLNQKGIALKKTRDGFVATSGKSVVGQGSDLPDLLNNINYRPEKIPREFGARLAYVDNNAVGLTVENGIAVGNKRKILQFINTFVDDDKLLKSTKVYSKGTETILKKGSAQYQVDIPDAGISKVFNSYSEAKKFANNAFSDLETIEDIAIHKGLLIKTTPDGWEISDNGTLYKPKTISELKNVLKQFPDPDAAPDILPQALKQIDEFGYGKFPPIGQSIDNSLNIQTPHKDLHLSMWRTLVQDFEPPKDALIKGARQLGIGEDLIPLIRDLETSIRGLSSEITTGNKLITSMFVENGKIISLNRLKGITHLLDNIELKWDTVIDKYHLTDKDIKIARQVRRFLGEDPTQGLFAKFGISYDSYRNNYISHIKKLYQSLPPAELDSLTTETFMRKAFGETVPKEYKFWAENTRVSELLHEANDDNILTILLRYNTQGHKKLILNPIWNKINEYMGKAGNNVPERFISEFNLYRQRVMGFTLTDFDKKMAASGRAFMREMAKRMGKEFTPEMRQLGNDLWQHTQSLIYTSLLALKPFVIMKQAMQPWFTLGTAYGYPRMYRAIKKVMADPDNALKLLTKFGYVDETLPSIHELSFGKPGKIGSFTRSALARFKTADMLPRAIGVEVGNDMVEEAATRWNARYWKTDNQFFKATELNLFDADIRQSILNNIKAGRVDIAKEIGANFVQETSFFGYNPRFAPRLFTGSYGKLFGNLGTYTTQFIQYVNRSLRNGTWSQRAGFVTRLSIASWASYKAFESIGVRGSDYLPWEQASFAGGPLALIAIRIPEAITRMDYRGDIARADLLRRLQAIAPGVSNVIHIKKGLEAAAAGDPWKAFLYFTNTPLSPHKW